MAETVTRLKDVEKTISNAFADTMPELKIEKVVVTERYDDPAIVDVLAHVPFRNSAITTSELLRLPTIAREAMRKAGDGRYPSVDTQLSKGQKVRQG